MPAPPTLATALLPALDTIRGIRGQLGLNPYTVTVTRRVDTGERPGVGVPIDTTTQVMVANGTQPVTVRQVSARDVAASGGLYRARDLKVGPLTPAYAATLLQGAGGYTDATLDSAPDPVQTVSIFWTVTGPGIPSGGVQFVKVFEENTSLHTYLILRATAEST